MKPELQYSEAESRRFRLRVVRAQLDELDVDGLIAAVVEDRSDVVIARIPSEKQHQLSALNRLGVPWISADVLVYYYADLKTYEPQSVRNPDLEFFEATPDDAPALETMIREIFSGYANHYSANPVFDLESILDGYVEWGLGHISDSRSKTTAWIARRDDKPVAFAACRYDEKESEGVLVAVRPAESGKGVYNDLIRHTLVDTQIRRLSAMKISTQVQNFPVQAVWARQGFTMRKALVTFHVNAMLSSSLVPTMIGSLPGGDRDQPLISRVDEAVVASASAILGGPQTPLSARHGTLRRTDFDEPLSIRVSLPDHPDGPTTFPVVAEVVDAAGRSRHLASYEFPKQ